MKEQLTRIVAIVLIDAVITCSALPVLAGNPNSYFISQFRDRTNVHGLSHDEDCGPTCLAMAAKRWHKIPHGFSAAPAQSERLISKVRELMTGRDNHMQPTHPAGVIRGAESLGLHAFHIPKLNLQQLDHELEQGHMVIAAGNPMATGAYGNRLSKQAYWHNNTGHWILVTEHTTGGKYLVNDPMSRKGTLTILPQGLLGFLNAHAQGDGIVLLP